MKMLSKFLIAFVMLSHLGFLVLEVFLYQHPLGLTVFKVTLEFAQSTEHIMFNQGVYNGFLSFALLIGLVHPDSKVKTSFSLFGLSCVVVAGVAGAVSISGRIFFIQALPALIGLVVVLIDGRRKS